MLSDDLRAALMGLLATVPRCTESVGTDNSRCQNRAVRSWSRIPTHCEEHGSKGELLGVTHRAPVPRMHEANAIEAAERALAAAPVVVRTKNGSMHCVDIEPDMRWEFDDEGPADMAAEVAEALGARVVRR